MRQGSSYAIFVRFYIKHTLVILIVQNYWETAVWYSRSELLTYNIQ